LGYIEKFYNNLKELCVENCYVYDMNNNSIFFKIIKKEYNLVMYNMSQDNTMRNYVNHMFEYLILTEYSDSNPAWSTHSFRYTVITRLINKLGIEKTSTFIGHKCINTTQLYYKKKNENKILKEAANLL